MRIGTLLTSATAGLTLIAGAAAGYVALSKHEAMDALAEAKVRLDIIRSINDVPRYLVPERGYATNFLYSPDIIHAEGRKELKRQRDLTVAARDKMLALRNTALANLADKDALGKAMDAVADGINKLHAQVDAALPKSAPDRRKAAEEIVAFNAVVNKGVMQVTNEQVRLLAPLSGATFRQASYANLAWSLRDLAGYNSSLHKSLIGDGRVASAAETAAVIRAQARADQVLGTLLELRADSSTAENVKAALEKMNELYVERLTGLLTKLRASAQTGRFDIDVESYYKVAQEGLGSIIAVREAFYENADREVAASYAKAVTSFQLALAGVVLALVAGFAIAWATLRRVSAPIAALNMRMQELADGNLDKPMPYAHLNDEMGAMAKTLLVFRDAARDKIRMERAAEEARVAAEAERLRTQAEAIEQERALVTRSFGSGMSRLAEKDLSFRLDAQLPEAYATLQADFNRAMDALEEALASVAESSRTIDGSTSEIAVSATDLARRTEAQAASLEQTAAAVEEITATSRKAAEGAAHARQVVAEAKTDAEKTGVVVRKAVTAIAVIEKSSEQMSRIIGVIDEIAFQTNLLALNAGVEAARAGDAGRGFAVVASEVRGLAQRSAEAAKEIKGLIQASSAQVTEGVDLVAATGTALERILAQVDDINKVVADIAAGAQTQATGLSEINSAIAQMDQSTQQNAAMVEETTTASSALEQQSVQLAELIGAFRLRGHAGSHVRARPQPRRRAA